MRAAAGSDFVRSLVDQVRSSDLFGALWRKNSSEPEFAEYTDQTIAGILRGMRTTLGVSRAKLARSFDTTELMIERLEEGYVPTVATWPEVARVVGCYGEALRVDTHPILVRLDEHVRRCAPRQRTMPAGHTPTAPERRAVPAPDTEAETESRPSRRKHRLLLTISAPLVVVMGAAWISQAAMPHSVTRPLKASVMHIVSLVSPRLDGLRWINVADPRTRKADRLAVETR